MAGVLRAPLAAADARAGLLGPQVDEAHGRLALDLSQCYDRLPLTIF